MATLAVLLLWTMLTCTAWACKKSPTGSARASEGRKHEFFFTAPAEESTAFAIKILKRRRALELYANGRQTGRFRIALGRSPKGDKHREGDCRTPEGSYYICTRSPSSNFTLFLGLSYPGVKDARWGLQRGLIGQNEFDAISAAVREKRQPPWNTPLGGAVGIHGGGAGPDWTLGCIALSDEDIRRLWDYTPLGTLVIVER